MNSGKMFQDLAVHGKKRLQMVVPDRRWKMMGTQCKALADRPTGKLRTKPADQVRSLPVGRSAGPHFTTAPNVTVKQFLSKDC